MNVEVNYHKTAQKSKLIANNHFETIKEVPCSLKKITHKATEKIKRHPI